MPLFSDQRERGGVRRQGAKGGALELRRGGVAEENFNKSSDLDVC